MFLIWAVACSWNPTLVSVLLTPSWGRTFLLLAFRGLWPFSCGFCSGHSSRCSPTALDQKEIRPCKPMIFRTLSLAHTFSSPPKWHGVLYPYSQAYKCPRKKHLMPWQQQSGVSVLSVMIYYCSYILHVCISKFSCLDNCSDCLDWKQGFWSDNKMTQKCRLSDAVDNLDFAPVFQT